MSKQSLVAIIFVLTVFGGFMTRLHYKEIALIDERLQQCSAEQLIVA